MNILPKKRWHVRTKDNIARVRRDEAAAQEEEKKRQGKLELAESEARINFLRRQAGLPEKPTTADAITQDTAPPSSVDLFADYKSHVKTTNKALEKEKKEEQEKYEKQIGYLTYLGQDTNEALKVRSWYEQAPKRAKPDESETHLKQKLAQDPLTLINALIPGEKKTTQKATKLRLPTPTPEQDTDQESVRSSKSKKSKNDKKHHKKDKKHKHKSHKSGKDAKELAENSKREKLNRLRKERLRREAAEKLRQEQLFAPKESEKPASALNTPAQTPRVVQKYNSQFNPELAKQNMI